MWRKHRCFILWILNECTCYRGGDAGEGRGKFKYLGSSLQVIVRSLHPSTQVSNSFMFSVFWQPLLFVPVDTEMSGTLLFPA